MTPQEQFDAALASFDAQLVSDGLTPPERAPRLASYAKQMAANGYIQIAMDGNGFPIVPIQGPPDVLNR